MMNPRGRTVAVALDSDIRILQHVEATIGRAVRREPALRFVALDENGRASPRLLSLTGQPSRFDEDMAAGVAEWVDECADVVSIARLVAVWQRRGRDGFEEHELPWMLRLSAALRERGYPVRAWLLSHSRGVRWVAYDDLLPSRAG